MTKFVSIETIAERWEMSKDTIRKQFKVGTPGVMKRGRCVRVAIELVEAAEKECWKGFTPPKRKRKDLTHNVPSDFLPELQ